MATISVLNWKKEKVGTLELPADIFDVEIRKDILHEVVNWQLACRRQGTAMVKTRGFVSGGGKKPFKQKGTGNARQGSTRSPLMPGGAKLFGPVPRSYDFALPKKVRRMGLRVALSHALKEGKLFVVDNMPSDGKTKDLANRLSAFGIEKALMVDVSQADLMKRASRNLKQIKYFSVDGLNVFDVLKFGTVVVSKDSIVKIAEKCRVE